MKSIAENLQECIESQGGTVALRAEFARNVLAELKPFQSELADLQNRLTAAAHEVKDKVEDIRLLHIQVKALQGNITAAVNQYAIRTELNNRQVEMLLELTAECDQLRAQLRAQTDEANGQEPIKLSADVKKYIRDSINEATQCETDDQHYEFANGLAQFLKPLYAAPIHQQTTPAESVQIVREEIKQVLIDAAQVVAWRNADISTEDGNYAATDADAIIRLEESLCTAFKTSSDDVVLEEILPLIEAMEVPPKIEHELELCFHNTGEDSSKHYTSYTQPVKTVRDIDNMVSKFLGWRLPEDFSPDCGISFVHNDYWGKYPNNWPIGTNLFNAVQAKAMIENILSAPQKVERDEDNSCGCSDCKEGFPCEFARSVEQANDHLRANLTTTLQQELIYGLTRLFKNATFFESTIELNIHTDDFISGVEIENLIERFCFYSNPEQPQKLEKVSSDNVTRIIDNLKSFGEKHIATEPDKSVFRQTLEILKREVSGRGEPVEIEVGSDCHAHIVSPWHTGLSRGRHLLYSQPSPNKADVRDWQPIETAPKDGNEILLCSAVLHDIGLCYWREDNVMTGWTWGMEQRFNHAKWWMPLPDTKMLPPIPEPLSPPPLPPLKDN